MAKEKRDAKKPKKPSSGGYLKKRPRRPCYFCENKIAFLDYKDISLLHKFLTERGKILPPKQSCCCAKHQRDVAVAVKKARSIGLVPFTVN